VLVNTATAPASLTGSAAVPQAAAQPILAVKNIEVIYDHVILVLRGVSFEVPQGKIVALLGANGAGKSTTLKSVSTLLASERGEVTKGSIEFRGQRTEALFEETCFPVCSPRLNGGRLPKRPADLANYPLLRSPDEYWRPWLVAAR
jgi:ABC-type dipeptide/oligopeptide/nickel transport system ATPase component